MQEFPRKYEYMEGGKIRPHLRGKVMPVAPEWVRRRNGLPTRCQYACLSKELEAMYPKEVRDKLVKYVLDWPYNKQAGVDLVIAGEGHPMKRLWAGAAILNEIVMRYSQISSITTDYMTTGRVRWLIDARNKKDDMYPIIRSKMLKAKLLLLDDPMKVGDDSDARWWLQTLYEHRYNNQLPTITLLTADVTESWDRVKKVLGPNITDTLRINGDDYVVNY